MRCPNCGEELKAGSIYCEKCGQELQIVPDYDPLDELLIGRDSLLLEEETKKEKQPVKETKQENAAKEKEKKKFWKQPVFWKIILLFCVVLAGFFVFLFSYFSVRRDKDYSYQMKKGLSLMKREQYEEAIPYLRRAQELQSHTEGADTRPLRYLAQAYAQVEAKDLAVSCMKEALLMEESAREDHYELEEIYREFMEILNMTRRTDQVNEVIESCKYREIQERLRPYRIAKPSCSLPEGSYSYYVSLELEADYGSIYYTLDGTEPTKDSPRYVEPIRLLEGETFLSAVAINKKGMVSEKLVLVYKLRFPKHPVEEEEESTW